MALRPIQLCIVFTIGFYLTIATQEWMTLPNSPQQRLSVELKDPKDVIVAKGQPASLACAIQATKGNVDLVWLYNGIKIPLNDSRWQLLDNGTLYIPKVTGKRMNSVEGLYQCLVKNNIGALLSKAARLSVATLGKEFHEQPTNVTVQEGRPALLPCKIDSFPSGTVTWIRNNLTLPQAARYVPLPSGDLLITTTLLSDSGSYSCNVVNPILKNKAKESSVGWLTVMPMPPRSSNDFAAPPQFLPLRVNRTVTALVGNNVSLYCAGDGWPLPTLSWTRENRHTSLGNSSVLTIRNVTEESTGKYVCVAKNRLGSINQTFYLEAHQPPYFNGTLESRTFVTPVTLRIPCNAHGIPEPKVYWLKNGEELSYNVRQRNELSTLIISNSVTQDMGFYQCIAENAAGKAWVAAQYIPRDLTPDTSPPMNVKCRPFNDNSICIHWRSSENATAYVVYHFYSDADTETLSVTNLTYLMLENLNKSTTYTLYVRAFTRKVSDQSEHIVCKTGIIGKRNLEIRSHNDTSVRLNWRQISTDVACDGTHSDYRVQWRRTNQIYSNVEYVKGTNHYISDLQPSVAYQFRVTSSAAMGKENSPWVDFQVPGKIVDNTTETTPPVKTFNTAPYNLKAEYINSSSISLSWSHHEKNNVSSFFICQIELNSKRNCQQTNHSKLTKFNVTNLQPSTVYEFRVQAKYNNGSSSLFSKTIEVRTLSDVLDSPTIQDVKHLPLNSSSICLRWRAPHTINGTRVKYSVSYKNSSRGVIEKKIDVTTSQHCWIPPSFDENVFQTQLTKLNPRVVYNVTITSQYQNISKAYWIMASTRKINTTTDNEEEDIYRQQKLGFILGIAISLCGVISCVSCLIYSLKKRKCANAAPPCRAIYYNVDGNPAATIFGNCNQARHQESCGADTQEMQNLIGENGICHVPSFSPGDLDTKAGGDFPNRQANGSLHHPPKTAYIPNGHVHITVNPQFYIHSQNQNAHSENEPMLHPTQEDSYEEDSNSNLQNTKLRQLLCHETERGDNMKKFSSSELGESLDSSVESGLNCTQLTNLDDFGASPIVYRKISIPLAPNG